MIRRDDVFAIDGVLEEQSEWVLEEGEGEEMKSDYFSGVREPHERVTHIDDVPVSRPSPKVEREQIMRRGLRFFCPTCSKLGNPVVMYEASDFDYDGQTISLQCRHDRPVTLATVNA